MAPKPLSVPTMEAMLNRLNDKIIELRICCEVKPDEQRLSEIELKSMLQEWNEKHETFKTAAQGYLSSALARAKEALTFLRAVTEANLNSKAEEVTTKITKPEYKMPGDDICKVVHKWSVEYCKAMVSMVHEEYINGSPSLSSSSKNFSTLDDLVKTMEIPAGMSPREYLKQSEDDRALLTIRLIAVRFGITLCHLLARMLFCLSEEESELLRFISVIEQLEKNTVTDKFLHVAKETKDLILMTKKLKKEVKSKEKEVKMPEQLESELLSGIGVLSYVLSYAVIPESSFLLEDWVKRAEILLSNLPYKMEIMQNSVDQLRSTEDEMFKTYLTAFISSLWEIEQYEI